MIRESEEDSGLRIYAIKFRKVVNGLMAYDPIMWGCMAWEHVCGHTAERGVEYAKTREIVRFSDIPAHHSLEPGAGWNRVRAHGRPDRFLSVRETPVFNFDIEHNPSAVRPDLFPLHIASFGFEDGDPDLVTVHLQWHYGNDYPLSVELVRSGQLRADLAAV